MSGRITDQSDGAAIPGVNVLLKGTAQGTTTDSRGSYTLSVTDPNSILVFSFIGFGTQEVQVNNRASIDIVMEVDIQTLSEVVVVGYGSQSEKELTGSVQQVKSEEFRDLPVAQVTQKLQGRLAGVQISQTTGTLGRGMSVRIRGQVSILAGSEPLYVVDGLPIVGDISNINPDEIESISVLKDAASTALYGSRAANGVVLITTKRAKTGKTTVDVNSYYGIQEVPQQGRPVMMNGTEFAQFKKESYEDLAQPVPAAFQNPAQYGEGYDWYGGMLRNAPVTNHSITIASSKDGFSTSAVLGYFKQDGVMKNSDFTRYSLRVNSEFKVNNKLRAGFNVAPSYSINNTPTSDGAFYGQGLLYNALLTWPIFPYENNDGSMPLTAYIPGVSAFPTPNWYRALKEIKNQTKTTRLLSNAYVNFEPIKGLNLKSSLSVDIGSAPFFNFQPSTSTTGFTALPPVLATSIRRQDQFTSWLNENIVTYTKSIKDHNFDVLGGFSGQKYRQDILQVRATEFPDDRLQTVQAAINVDRTQTTSDVQEWALVSFFGRVNYNFKGKYLFGASIRRDGSSRFGADNRWGNFPSISAGWVISDEQFMPETKAVSFLKLRASVGTIGNNNIGNYTQYASVALGQQGNINTNAIFGSTVTPGAGVTSLSNANLGWETTRQVDVGLDIGLFNNRVSVVYDYYNKNTTNLLYNVSVPQESGFTNFNGNVGELKFWGHEFTVASKNLTGKLRWNTDFNIAFNDNQVVALSDGVNRLYGNPGNYATITQVGQRVGQFWGLVWDGVYTNQGDYDSSPKNVNSQVGTIKYKDINGDGVITFGGDNDDRTYIGNPFPRAVMGLTNTFSYGGLDLSIVLSGSFKNDVLVMLDQGGTNLDGVFNVSADVKDRWRSPSNPGSGRYGKTTSATFMERDWESSRFVSDGTNVTIRNVTLGYNIPANKIFRSLRVYAGVQQLYRFTNYRGPNPEASSSANPNANLANPPISNIALGFDWATYPIPRTYTLGLNIGL